MKSSELLEVFEDYGGLHELRDTSTRAEVLAALPTDPAEYVEAARDALGGLTLELYDAWTEECNVYQRFEDILRELFYADERTLEALLWIVEWSVGALGLADFGINPLAIIASQLERRPLRRFDDQDLIESLQRWAQHPELNHNATESINRILRRLRRPDTGGA